MSDYYLGSGESIARNNRKCDWCCGVIHKRELYLWFSGIYDNRIYKYGFHPECLYDFRSNDMEEWYPGEGSRPDWRFTDDGLKEFFQKTGRNLKKLEKYKRPILTFDYL